ncbi:MAG: hypothetical protein KGJ89_04620 [Patescibacteria group bacterium]|nr:hypothetical protein [Patescibacteria group bacterium]MDE2015836.1 hypothetical protein [Patescibacteria group bacterium]MDE2227211.1 hypothetical protein [Patescibacteria group bacterium]
MEPIIKKITARHSKTGFTLFETVIYIGLFSLVSSLVLVIFFQILSGNSQQVNRVEVDAESNFMMQKIIWALTGAQTINQPAINTTSTVLSVNKYNYASNPIVFDLGSRNLTISEGGGQAIILGSSRVYVSQLIFEHLPAVQSAPEAIKVTLGVFSADITRPSASTTITDTIYLR